MPYVTSHRWGFCGLLLVVLLGCSSSPPTFEAELQAARVSLQTNQTQTALDQLAKLEIGEAHYLRAVALQRQKLPEAAAAEIKQALAFEVDNPRYQAFELLLQLTAGKKDAAAKLVELYQHHPANGAVALFATPACIAQRDIPGATKAFETALSLIDECPEFMFFALNHALVTKKFDAVDRLVRKLQAAAPENTAFLKDLLKVAVRGERTELAEELLAKLKTLDPDSQEVNALAVETQLLLKRPDQARELAADQARQAPANAEVQLAYAETLFRAPPTAENEKKLAALCAQFPEQPEFVAKFALYLAKQQRTAEGLTAIDRAMKLTKSPLVKAHLLHLAIGIPLEAQDARLSQQQLTKFQDQFSSSEMLTYFEGRVAYLHRDYDRALAKFQDVLDRQADLEGSGRSLAAECLVWVERTLKARLGQQRVKNAVKSVKGLQNKPRSESMEETTPMPPTDAAEPLERPGLPALFAPEEEPAAGPEQPPPSATAAP